GAGGVIHSESAFGDGLVMVVGPPSGAAASPLAWAGRHTASVHIQVEDGIDAHCERARAAGAVIQREPATQPYGDRVYTCLDLEGHPWSIGQTLVEMTAEQMAAATGREIKEGL
ncbi:MAG TPA: VOC family protein, partial [Caulobacteraceae bacterium]|nr:VOC family protein [Caulobacteraceae bacterium]